MFRQFILFGALGYVGWYVWVHNPQLVLLLGASSALCAAALLSYPRFISLFYSSSKLNPSSAALEAPDLSALSPGDFEREVARATAVVAGAQNVRRVGGSGDGGVDVELLDHGRVVGVIQCKHKADPRHTVGPEVIRDMDSTQHRAGAKFAAVVTNGRFTSGSRALAKQYGITLIDGPAFERFRQAGERKNITS